MNIVTEDHTSLPCFKASKIWSGIYSWGHFVVSGCIIYFASQPTWLLCQLMQDDVTYVVYVWFCLSEWSLQWRHNEHDGVSDHEPHDCLFIHLFRRISNKTSKLHVTGLCVGNSPVTGVFPAQGASNAEKIFIWWRHHVLFARDLRLQVDNLTYDNKSAIIDAYNSLCLDLQ